jgi:ABC-type nitrate/sulfonate/bicarbonate transport system substrate-binding protein
VALLTVALSAGSVVGVTAQDGELTKIRLGISPFQDTMLPIIAQEKGWFEEAGLDVELSTLGWDAVMPAVASGSVDVAINNTTGVVSVADRAPNVIYWYGWNPFTEGSALMGRPDIGLVTVDGLVEEGVPYEEARTQVFEQLKDLTVVTTMATDMGKQVTAAAESVGVDMDEIDVVDMNPDQGLAAFLSGTGDVYLGGIPQRTRATAEGMIVVASGPDLAPPPINGFVTTSDFATANEDAMLALMNVMFRIVRYCNENTAECGEIITEELNAQTGAELTVDGFVDFWQVFENYAGNASEVEEIILSEDGYSYWKDTWDGDNEFFKASGDITEDVDPADHFWGERVQEAYVEKYGADETGY